ncbi:UDP-N-acetylmuramoyl-L-alanine--D-glutamate ligase [Legionella sp. CNM-4043-24]|uniref:UDP-N-acetylmuramoyl-L-alanine--D-glutamate ligase n=1 Tax=Legionella sp. CNM-4043-24 TaxID=3421646 RepID=UPI00403A995E
MSQALYLVAGLGKTGRSIAGYLQRRQLPFVVYDTRAHIEGLDDFCHDFPGVEVFAGEFPEHLYPRLGCIIASPGVALDAPFILKAQAEGISVIGDIECLAREIKVPVIAITGTNGKSTVTTLVGEMARAAGLSVAVAGNIGLPVLDLLDDGQHYDLWVLELSSFQLDLVHSLAPIAATILNVSPDHLDRHHTLSAYISAKQRVYHQALVCVYNRDDAHTIPVGDAASARSCHYGLDEAEGGDWGIIRYQGSNYLAQGKNRLLSVDSLRLKGRHNWQNALAACALADAAGIDVRHMIEVLSTFAGLPHRCQWVRTLDGVDWINDSKGTNIGATISAISGIGGSMAGKIVLIAGGLGKGADFSELQITVGDFVRTAVLIGADAEKIAQALSGVTPIVRATTLDEAIRLARARAQPGDVVLLSPACASQDMFRDFNHRGEAFAQIVDML